MLLIAASKKLLVVAAINSKTIVSCSLILKMGENNYEE